VREVRGGGGACEVGVGGEGGLQMGERVRRRRKGREGG
jgi:hypothetical protein